MTESSTAKSGSRAAPDKRGSGNRIGRLVGSLSLFVRQVLDELRKVVRPTGSELLNFTIVVILFVLAIMAIVAGLDFVFNRLVLAVFAGS